MMKHAFLFLALSSSVWGSEELLQGLAALNQQEVQNCSNMSNEELSLQCAHEVCGSPENITIAVTPKNADKYLSPENQAKLKSLDSKLREYYTKINNDDKQFMLELEKRVLSSSFHDISTWKEDDFQNFLPFLTKNIDLQIDYQAPVNQRKIKSLSFAGNPFSKVHNEIAQNLSIIDHPFLALQLGVISAQELRPVLIERLGKIQEILKSQNKTITFNIENLKFGLKSGAKNNTEMIDLFYQLEAELKDKGIQSSKSLCGEECRKAVPGVLKNFKLSDFKKEQTQKNNLNIEDRVALCKASFVNANVENTRFEEFKKIWPEVKNGYYKNVLPKYSAHSQGLLKNYLETSINFIPSSQELKKFPDVDKALAFTPPSYQQKPTSYLMGKALSPSHFETHAEFDCPVITDKPLLWDAFASKDMLRSNPSFRPKGIDTGKDNILISPFSCEHTGVGKGIIAHEVGHAITHVMSREGMSKSSKKAYVDMRKCSSNQWKNHPKTQMKFFDGDYLYTEEDNADIMSYMAINDQKSFFSCGVLYPTDSGYKELKINPQPFDNHSPGIVRLIREIQYKAPDKMPATCQEIFKRNKDKFGKKCF